MTTAEPCGLGLLVPRLAAEYPAFDIATRRTVRGLALVAVRHDGAALPGTYAVVTSDPAELRRALGQPQTSAR
jgi:hypothetical protein